MLGFTEHDHDLTFDDTGFSAASGFQAADSEVASGLSVEAGEIAGGFSSVVISEADVIAGRYDGATVEVFQVNWQAPDQRILLRVQEIGDVVAAGGAFRAELRRLTHRLDQVQGRIYGRRCDAVFGDRRCKVDVSNPAYRGSGTIAAVLDGTRIRVSGLDAAVAGFFRYGMVTFVAGANAGHVADIEDHRRDADGVTLSLWLPPPLPLAAGRYVCGDGGMRQEFCHLWDGVCERCEFPGISAYAGDGFCLWLCGWRCGA